MKKTSTSRQDMAVRRKRVVTEEWEEVLHSATSQVTKDKPAKVKPRISTGTEIPLFADVAGNQIPEYATKSAYEKGKDFELAFADWLRTEGYETIKIRKQVFGAVTTEEPDVYASKTVTEKKEDSSFAHLLGLFSLIVFVGAAFVYGSGDDVWALVFCVFGLGLAIFAIIAMPGKPEATQHHVWAECKHIGDKVDKAKMNILTGSVRNFKKSASASWQPGTVMFASFSGFQDSALEVAKAEGVECYVPDGGGFVRVGK